jgi:hypothetical protein
MWGVDNADGQGRIRTYDVYPVGHGFTARCNRQLCTPALENMTSYASRTSTMKIFPTLGRSSKARSLLTSKLNDE